MGLSSKMKDSNSKSKKAKKPVKVVLKKITTKELLANRECNLNCVSKKIND